MTAHLPELFRLDGRVALVTGATGHLGGSMVEALCEGGAHVVMIGRRRNRLNALSRQFAGWGLKVTPVVGDIANQKFLKTLFRKIRSDFGHLEILLHAAYEGVTKRFEEARASDFEDAYGVSVGAAHEMLQLAIPLLKKGIKKFKGTASVINIGSMYGMVSPDFGIYEKAKKMTNPPFYGPAKAGLLQYTRYAACYFGKEKIRVNSLSLGAFPPAAVTRAMPHFYRRLRAKNPLGRIGDPSDVKGAVLYLASEASAYVSGTNLTVDGGWTAW